MSIFKVSPFKDHIGMDISDYKIRFFQTHALSNSKIRVESYGEIDTKKDQIVSGDIKDKNAVVELIKTMFDNPVYGKPDGKYIHASLPEKKIFIKTVVIPKVPENEIKGAVAWAVEQNIPLEIDDSYFDWQVLGPNHKNSNSLNVLISVAPKNIVDTYTQILSDAGLTPIGFENESISIARCLIDQNSNIKKPLLILDLGRSRSNVIIADNNSVYFTSTVDVSGREMTEALAKSLDLSLQDAEKGKIIFGLDDKKARGKVKSTLEPVIDRLIEKISEGIDFFNNYAEISGTVSSVLLTGSVCRMVGLPEYMQKNLSLPVIAGDPWNNAPAPKIENNETKVDFLSYATAIGLALKKFQ